MNQTKTYTADELHQIADELRLGIERAHEELLVADETADLIDAAARGEVSAEVLQAVVNAFHANTNSNLFAGVLLACEPTPTDAVN